MWQGYYFPLALSSFCFLLAWMNHFSSSIPPWKNPQHATFHAGYGFLRCAFQERQFCCGSLTFVIFWLLPSATWNATRLCMLGMGLREMLRHGGNFGEGTQYLQKRIRFRKWAGGHFRIDSNGWVWKGVQLMLLMQRFGKGLNAIFWINTWHWHCLID